MPIYEYRCRECGAISSVFFRTIAASEAATPSCERCAGAHTERLISRSFVVKGTAGRIDDFDAGRALGGLEGSDPGSFARWARRMSDDLGESGGDRFRDLAERAEAGDDPIERIDPGHTLRYELSQQRESASSGERAGDTAGGADFL